MSGVILGNADWISGNRFFLAYEKVSGLDIDLKEFSLGLFFEQFAPNALLASWALVLLLAAFHRMVWGATEGKTFLSAGFIEPLEEFGSLLAIAWLGLMLGLMWPALLFEGWASFFKFAFLCLYPVMYLGEMSMFVRLLSWHGLAEAPIWMDKRVGWRLGTRAEGAALFLGALLFLAFQKWVNDFIQGWI